MLETGRAALDDHRADAADAGAEADIDEKDRGIRAEGGKHLGAVDDGVRAVRPRGGGEIGRRRSGIGLAHAEAHHRAAGEQIGQPARLLRRAAVFRESADRAEIAELDHVGAARADRCHLLDGDHGVHQRAALAAVRLRDGDAHQPLRAHQLGDVEGKARIVRALERAFFQMGQREAADRIRQTVSALR